MNGSGGRWARWIAAPACLVLIAACGGGDQFVLSEHTSVVTTPTTTLHPSVLDHTLIGALTAGDDDVSVLVIGDSTGDDAAEWVFLAFQELADRFPTHTFVVHPWDAEGSDDWGPPRRLWQGSGEHTVDIWNFSASGRNTSYGMGDRFPALLATQPDQIVISHGKNEGSPDRGSVRGQMMALTESLRADLPGAPITLVLQPPNADDDEMMARNDIYRELADNRGFGVVDVFGAFAASPDPNALLKADGIHPTTASDAPAPNASQLWADTFLAAAQAATAVDEVPSPLPSTLISDGDPILTETFDRSSSAEVPPGWELVGAVVAPGDDVFVDPHSPAGGAIRLTVTGDEAGGIRYQWPNDELESLRGTTITVAVRVYVEDGQPVTAGRIGWADGVSVVNSGNYVWARDGWHWRVLDFTVDPAAAYLRLTLYADTSSETDGTLGEAWFGRLTVASGRFPHDLVSS